MFKIFLKFKIKLWKLWIKIRYGKNYFNDLHKLVENTKLLEDLERQIENKECIDCKFFIPGNYFSAECMICDNGSKFVLKQRKKAHEKHKCR